MASADDIAARVTPQIQAALDEFDPMARWQQMRAINRDAFLIAWDDLTPGGDEGESATEAADQFVGSMQSMMMYTHPDESDDQAARIAAIIGRAAENAAVVASSPDADKTWRTMRDDRVRELHVPMEGVTVGALETFDVGGFDLLYPGQPVGPPDVWINCRCTLSLAPTLASGGAMEPNTDTLEAAVSEEPWSNFSASDYSIEQWRRACLLKMPGGDPESKSTYKLPVRTPSGAVNRAGVHAAAAALGGARGGVDAPPAAKESARRKLRGLYRQLKEEPPDSLAADAAFDEVPDDVLIVAAPGTRDGPGWATNPRDTQRLRDYWTRGAGAAKIAWGTPGDFNRCRAQLGKYISNPSYLAGTCANLHKVALGFWPATHAKLDRGGRHAAGAPAFDPDFDTEEFAAVTAAFIAAEDVAAELPPGEWFQNPQLDGPTPLTVSDDGRIAGHLATWGTCHVGIQSACTEAPHSAHDYAYFRTGETMTSAGPIPVGQITMETGHAGTDLGPTAAVSHYDDTGTVVADVAAGEDDYGIWVAGMTRPGLSDGQLRSLRAGALSGDWRRIGGNLELVAALVVNVPGFPIPRTQVASAAGHETALVAAAVVTLDPNVEFDADRVAVAVMAAMDKRSADSARRARAAALAGEIAELRVNALALAVEG